MSPKSDTKNILLLTTTENFAWLSMSEILPEIEACWKEAAAITTETKLNIETLNVDNLELSKALKKFIQADCIVFTAFNFKMAKLAKAIRKDFSLSSRFVFYLHGMTSIGCWPMLEFGMKDVFTTNDIFVSTAANDKEALLLSFSNANVKVIPFSLPDDQFLETSQSNHPSKFVYIGRISEQKNLHNLIWIFSLLLKDHPGISLEIYGKEDQLGSPNMEIPTTDYLNFLTNLVSELDISESVHFHGFVERNELYKNLEKTDYCFVSLSLHSDENFGMAALTSLAQRKPAILSDWGGHHDFSTNLGDQVSVIPVDQYPNGPVINPLNALDVFKEFLNKKESFKVSDHLLDYRRSKVAEKLIKDIILISHQKGEVVNSTPLALEVLEMRNDFFTNKNSQGTKIFEDYSDPRAHLFFQSYGMMEAETMNDKRDSGLLCPWVKIHEDGVTINDPHKGKIELKIPQEQVHQKLYELGYLF